MKQETAKKNNKLFLWIAIAAVVVAVGVALAVILPGLSGGQASEPTTTTSSKVYWNVDRLEYLDEETGLPIRKAGEDGLFHILFAVDGEQIELTCTDRKLVNRLDSADLMGLVFDANGQIIDVIKIDELVEKVSQSCFVQRVEEGSFTTNSSIALNGMEIKYNIVEATKIYDVTPEAEKIGAPGKIGVMDRVTVLQDAEGVVTHVFIVERALESRVYWRLDTQLYDSKTGMSTRPKDADGFVSYRFFVDGQYVTLRTDRQDCINAIDSYGNNTCALGLFFDENGIIVDVCNGGRASKGVIAANNYIVTNLDGNNFHLEVLSGTNLGKSYDGVITENTKIYDMTGTSDKPGIEVKELKVMDQVLVITNADGEVLFIYITRRRVDAPVYLVMTNRAYDTKTGETTQKPDENGWYVIDVVAGTKRMTVRTKDKEIASRVHEPVGRMIGLRLKGNEIIGTYNAGNITGGWEFALYEYVISMNGNIINTELGNKTSSNTAVMTGDCEVYLVGYESTDPTITKTKLKEHDRIMAMKNEKGEICLIYILERKLDVDVYWNIDGRKWDAAKKETSRVPNAEGYYVFNVTTKGKPAQQVKTKSKAIATFLDKWGAPYFALKVNKDGIIQTAYKGEAGVGGATVASYYIITKIDGNRVEAHYPSTGKTAEFTLNEGYKCYNISNSGAWLYPGEKATPKVGDKVHSLTNYYGRPEVDLMFIIDRPNPNGVVGWKYDRKYNSTTKETTREPDAEGYYVYQVAVKGKLETLKTKDKTVANFMDSQGQAVGMNVKNGIIYRAYIPYYVKGYGITTVSSYYSVTKIQGNKVYTENAAGQKAELTMMKGYECYDVSTYAEKFGAKATLKIGDRVQVHMDDTDKQVALVWIVYAYNRETDMSKPCPHCGETVLWIPYNGTTNGHFFMPSDYKGGQITVAADAEGNGNDFVLDMNGHDWDCGGKALLAWKGAKVYIYDSTGYDFTITGKGAKGSVHSGVIQLSDAELTLIGGNYVFDDSEQFVVYGGVMTTWSPLSKINATGVDFVGGTMVEDQPAEGVAKKDTKGGTISFGGGVANFNDCTFTGGVIPTLNGGNLYVGTGTTVNFNGCTFRGGEALRGGALAVLSGGKVTLADTLITGGKTYATGAGAGLFVYNGIVELNAGTVITGNTTGTSAAADNLWVSGTSSQVTMNGVKIDGGAQYAAGSLTVTGNTVIDKAGTNAAYGLKITNGKLLTVGELGENAKIGVLAGGVFTEPGDAETLKGYAESGKIFSDDIYAPVCFKDGALAVGIFRCINGHTEHTEGMECDEPIVAWKYWTDANAKAAITSWGGSYKTGEYKTRIDGTGNWILTDDITLATTRNSGSGADLRIDLNGHNIVKNVTENDKKAMVFCVKNNQSIEITDLSTEGEAGTVSVNVAEGVSPSYAYGVIVYAEVGNAKLAGRAVLDASNLSTANTTATAVQIGTNRTFAMYGGTIKGMTATGAGSAALGSWGGSQVVILDGQISCGTGERAVSVNGDFAAVGGELTGGLQIGTTATSVGNITLGLDAVIKGGVNIMNFQTMNVMGTPTVEAINIPDNKLVDFTGVTGGNITVRAAGTFSTDFESAEAAEAAMEFIAPADAGEFMEVKGNALAMKAPVTRCINGHTSHEGITCAEPIVVWKYWTNENAKASITSWGGAYADGEYKTRLNGTGNWILLEDVNLASVRTNGTAALRIDLNGHNVIRHVKSNGDNALTFNVSNAAGSIEITDLSTEGEAGKVYASIAEGVTPNYSWQGLVYAGANTFKLAGRAVIDASNLNSSFSGGTTAVQVNRGKSFIMYGGTVKGMGATNAPSTVIGAWSRYADTPTDAAIEIHGGQIIGTVSGKPAVYAPEKFTMTGGAIDGGLRIGEKDTSAGVVTISGNATVKGGVNILGFGTMTVSGTPTVEAMSIPAAENVDFTGVTGGNITVKANGYFSTDFASAEAATAATAFIKAAETGKNVTVNGAALTIGQPTTITRCINGHRSHAAGSTCTEPLVVWQYWTNETAKARVTSWGGTYVDGDYKNRLDGTGNWILTDDVTLTAQRAMGSGAALRIDLNGHNVTRKVTGNGHNTRVFTATNSYGLCITDLSTEGEPGSVRVEISAGVTPVWHAGTVVYAESGPVTLAGRAIIDGTGVSTTATSGMATVQVNGTHTFTMYGGTIKSMTATGDPAGALGGWGQTKIVIHGGLITSEGTSEQALYTTGRLTMDGGKVVGGVQIGANTGSAGVVTVGGTAEIDTFKLVGCTSCTLTGGAKIGTLTNTSGKEPVKENFTGTVG